MADNTEWLSVEMIYEELGRLVPLETIRSWIRSGKLKAYRPGKSFLVKREDFDKFMRDSQTDKTKED
jgi:excisionase family DNA binding protein